MLWHQKILTVTVFIPDLCLAPYDKYARKHCKHLDGDTISSDEDSDLLLSLQDFEKHYF